MAEDRKMVAKRFVMAMSVHNRCNAVVLRCMFVEIR